MRESSITSESDAWESDDAEYCIVTLMSVEIEIQGRRLPKLGLRCGICFVKAYKKTKFGLVPLQGIGE
jgi:hypothetical protein